MATGKLDGMQKEFLEATRLDGVHTYQPTPAEGEISDTVALEEIRHLLQHRRLVEVYLVRAD